MSLAVHSKKKEEEKKKEKALYGGAASKWWAAVQGGMNSWGENAEWRSSQKRDQGMKRLRISLVRKTHYFSCYGHGLDWFIYSSLLYSLIVTLTLTNQIFIQYCHLYNRFLLQLTLSFTYTKVNDACTVLKPWSYGVSSFSKLYWLELYVCSYVCLCNCLYQM